MKRKEKKEKSMKCRNVVPAIIVIIGIVMDILVRITGIFWVAVTESYMDYIYAAIITVSVLCFSFVALISGFLDKEYYGYKLREIIQFKESPVNFKYYIKVSLGAVVLATVFLAGNFVVSCSNSLTALLLAIICLEGNIAFDVYQIMTDDKLCYDLVIKHFAVEHKKQKSNLKMFQADVDRVVSALKMCTKKNDTAGKDAVCNMLLELGNVIQDIEEEDYYKYYDYFNGKIKECIYSFTNMYGYNEMIKTVIKIYSNLSEFKYGRIDLYLIPLKNMRFWNDQCLIEMDYFREIIEADFLEEYKNGLLTNMEIEKIFYCYFINVLENQVCSVAVKQKVIETCIRELVKSCWKTNEEGIEPDCIALLNIMKCFVLNNEDVKERDYIFQVIIKELSYNNLSYENKYFDLLSLIFQAFYAYIFCEKETLSEKYRNGLKNTFIREFSTATIAKMKASWLLRINIQSVLNAMGHRIANKSDTGKMFDYYPSFTMVKTVVWTQEFDVDYFFMLYLIYNDRVGYYSIYDSFFDWEEVVDDCKIFILKRMIDKFDLSTEMLKEDFVKRCIQYGELLNHTYKISDPIQKKLFKHIMEEYEKIIQSRLNIIQPMKTKMDYRDILNRIDELMKKDHVFGWSSDFLSDFYIKFTIPDCISRKEYRTPQTTARTLQNAIIRAVEEYIRRNTSELILTFDLDGIKKLLAFIKDRKYNARNYSFTDDWALAKYRTETDFIKLVEEEKKIELIDTQRIGHYLFFRKDNFMFNAKISKMEFLDLTEKECAEFLESSKSYNGLYNVDGALMSKQKAIKSVQKLYCKERYGFKLMVSFKRDEVTHIDF